MHMGTSDMEVDGGRLGQGTSGTMTEGPGSGGDSAPPPFGPQGEEAGAAAAPTAAAPAAAALATAAAAAVPPAAAEPEPTAPAPASAAAPAATPATPAAPPAASGPPWAVHASVALSQQEEEIFATLLGTVAMFNLGTVLRVAGGWVRDKLLGRECFDIDIALDDTLGREFAERVNKYLESKGETARGVGVIRSNPEQSKHLETATMMVKGQWIDLVNLRAESYADESTRIPSQIEFGTARQDALRRDLTINSMFYNINTKEVEDFTGRGLDDLRDGIVRTPLPPMQTFLDDPLRVLRSVRFAARFGFSVSEDLVAAASSQEVRLALGSKVSRERVGKETELMLKGRDPLGALSLLSAFGLFDTVFALPQPQSNQPQTQLESLSQPQPLARAGEDPSVNGDAKGGEREGGTHATESGECAGGVPLPGLPLQHGQQGLAALASAQRLMASFVDTSAAGDEVLVATRLAAALLPLRDCTFLDKKKNPVPVTQHIIRESLKLKASLAETVVSLHQHASAFQALVPLLAHSATASGAQPVSESGHTGADTESATAAAAGAGRGEKTASDSEPKNRSQEQEGGAAEAGSGAENAGGGKGGGLMLSDEPRVRAGKLLRKAKGSWRSALLLCAVMGDPKATQGTVPVPVPAPTQGVSGATAPAPVPVPVPAPTQGAAGATAPAPVPVPVPAPATVSYPGLGVAEAPGRGGGQEQGQEQGPGGGLLAKRMKLGSPGDAPGAPLSEWELECIQAKNSIVAMGLEGVWDVRPLLNGKEVISCLGLGKGSRETGVWMERAAEWQLAHPQGTPEECRAWLVEAKGKQ